jgi:hypothetical protein
MIYLLIGLLVHCWLGRSIVWSALQWNGLVFAIVPGQICCCVGAFSYHLLYTGMGVKSGKQIRA